MKIVAVAIALLALALSLPAAAQTTSTGGTLTPARLRLDTGTKAVTAAAGAATLNKSAGVVTTEALSTAAGATYTLTITNSRVAAADQVFASVSFGTASTGAPAVTRVTPAAGSVTVVVRNLDGSAALNGTVKIAFAVFKN